MITVNFTSKNFKATTTVNLENNGDSTVTVAFTGTSSEARKFLKNGHAYMQSFTTAFGSIPDALFMAESDLKTYVLAKIGA